jgi:hypothetical protein
MNKEFSHNNNEQMNNQGDQQKINQPLEENEIERKAQERAPVVSTEDVKNRVRQEGEEGRVDPDISSEVSGEPNIDYAIKKSSGNTMDPENQNSPNAVRGDNAIKNPDDWTTGEEPITGAQRSYLKTLSDEAGEEMDENLTKAEASKKIEELQRKTGRGK